MDDHGWYGMPLEGMPYATAALLALDNLDSSRLSTVDA